MTMNDGSLQGLDEWLSMFEVVPAMLSIAIGALVGWVFSNGLWHTVRALPVARRPVLLIGASSLLRVALVIGAFVALTRIAGVPYLVVALIVFIITRGLCVRFRLTEVDGRVADQ